MTISLTTSKPTNFTLGGAHFFSPAPPAFQRLFKVEADSAPVNPSPIELQVGVAGQRTAVDLSIEEAEALKVCLGEAITKRKDEEARIEKTMHLQARAFFADPDGPLEA